MTKKYASRRIWFLVARISIFSISGAIGFFGLGPVIETALRDLGRLAISSGLVWVACAALVAITADAAFKRVMIRPGQRADSTQITKLQLQVASASLLSAIVTLLLFDWGAENLESWRFAEQLESQPGISKRIRSEDGIQIAVLNLSGAATKNPGLGSMPTSKRLQMAGGTAKIAFRSSQTSSKNVDLGCSAARATNRVKSPSTNIEGIEIALSGTCTDWHVYDVEIPPGIALIEFRVSSDVSGVTELELASLGVILNHAVIWAVCVIGALFIMLASMLIVLFASKQRGFANSEESSTGSVQSAYFGRKELVWGTLATLTFLYAANLGVSSYVAKEHTIYAWDFGGHWKVAANLANSLTGRITMTDPEAVERSKNLEDKSSSNKGNAASSLDDSGAAEALLRNVRYAEYNATSAIPLALPMIIWGPTRLTYELAMVNVYGLSVVVALILLLSAVFRRTSDSAPVYWMATPALIVFFFNPFWVPLIRGYIGVSIVGINIFVLWLYFRRPLDQQRISVAVLVASLLVISVIFRRWNAYWVVGFFVIMLLDGAWLLLRDRRRDLQSIVDAFRFPFVTGLFSAAILGTLAWPLVVTMLTTDYSDIYSAYAEHAGNFSAHVEHFIRAFGVALIGLVAMSAVYLAYLEKYRRLAALLTAQILVMIVHFSSTQTMGPHHFYILMPAAFLLLGTAVIHAFGQERIITKAIAAAMVAIYCLNGVLSHIAVFSQRGDGIHQALVPMVPDNRRLPLARTDLAEFEKMAAYLDEVALDLPSTASIYVLASSTIISVAQLKMLEISTGIKFGSADRLLRTSAVDKRDGFPTELLSADLVLATDPVQFNRGAEFQQVIEIPLNQIRSGVGIGEAFEKMPAEFILDENVRVYVYQRTRKNSDVEIAELSNSLRQLYPDRPEIYSY